MRKIPKKLKEDMSADPYYEKCCMAFRGQCDGRITWEHTIIFASRQVNEKWAIIPLCEFHHAVNRHQDGGSLKKEMNVWVALNRATDMELRMVSKAVNYLELRDRYNLKYGVYKP